MLTTRKSAEPTTISPQQRRGDIIAILAAGLLRLSSARQPPDEKLSKSAEIGLELPRETRLSVPAG